MTERTVLISGASIAGPTLAFWLARYGLRPVVIERASELRLGGQNIEEPREADRPRLRGLLLIPCWFRARTAAA